MKKYTLVFSLIAVVISTAEKCGSDNSISSENDLGGTVICGKTDPVSQLVWLTKKVAQQTDKTAPGVPTPFRLVAYSYKGKTLIEDQSFVYSSPYIHVFNCDGSQALQVNEYTDFLDKRKKIKVLYEFK